jgi:hypothetical protein
VILNNIATILVVATILLFSKDNPLNAQVMKVEILKISNFPVGDILPEMS